MERNYFYHYNPASTCLYSKNFKHLKYLRRISFCKSKLFYSVRPIHIFIKIGCQTFVMFFANCTHGLQKGGREGGGELG